MDHQSTAERAKRIITALEDYGQGDYIGEPISQLEHCLQAAHQAQKKGARNELVLAALLHDIGQIIPLESTREARMRLKKNAEENVGRIGHDVISAEFLYSLGFSLNVCRLVKSHVAAKRYLTAVDQSYYNSLSSASQASLAFQGGPFKGDELAAFDQDLLRDEMVSLRLWNDAAKVPGIKDSMPRARSYFNRIVDHLEGKQVSA